ncbi:MAG TPA: S1/P1 nuclease [Allosphingosinicella sp.]|nr:S1/P1 nuclease [Allosphingosinicella sp.]
MHIILRRLFAAVFLILGLGWSSQALAWGDSGHRTVCEIALRNLTPAARGEVTRLLQAHPQILGANPLNAEYGWACTYPDHPANNGPGRRSPEHFANYPRTTLTVTSATGCGVAPLCVITAIAADFAILRSTTASDRDKAAALVYLGHWLGDIHQPLHSSFEDDRGGNEVNSRGLCTSSLHSTWDTCILQARHTGAGPSVDRVRLLAAEWSLQVNDSDRAAWLSARPWQWSAESYAITLAPSVGYCVMVGQACQYSATEATWSEGEPKRSVQIDATYMDWAMPIIQRRITQAGVRLGHLLNLALDPAYRG